LLKLKHSCFRTASVKTIKKEENEDFVGRAYGRFLSISLSISITTAPTTMIATNRPAIAGTKYMSATDCGVGVGAVVAAGAFIT
jgi:hypothetical protein